MAQKTEAQVTIGGKTYTLSGYESEEYILKVADYLNKKIDELTADSEYTKLPADMRQILLNLNIADDYFKMMARNEELSALIASRSGVDLGLLQAMEPLETGPSGRIRKLRLTGSKGTLVVGKELMIRRVLSPSHLKSSAFTATFTPDGKVRLDGRGWGHGVGLCQIGAAVMGSRGYTYDQILEHYYPGASLIRYEA